MKKVLMLLLTVALFAGCNSPGEKKGASDADQEVLAAEWVEVTLNVEGMTCDGCENAIKAGVETLGGIAEVESSWEEAWTKVKFDKNQTSLGDIEAKITETGYEVKGELQAF